MIETLDDWNDKLEQCGCCEMPECPAPIRVCEVKYAETTYEDTWDGITYDATGNVYAGDALEYQAFHPAFTGGVPGEEVPIIYRKYTNTYEEELIPDWTEDIPEDFIECTATVLTGTTYNTFGGPDLYIIRNIYTLSEPITKAEFTELALQRMEDTEWASSTNTGNLVCSSRKLMDWSEYWGEWESCPGFIWDEIYHGASARYKKLRFRFRIPDTHTGSKFFITYDIAEFPDDGAPSLVSEDNVIEWTGPGTGASSDPSWLTDWVVIDPPDVSGERRVVNVRYTCYSGAKYGAKPQLVGEAFP
jgi:hypothetical protein